MNDALNFIFVALLSYFIGTINFSKIIAWYGRHKDITKIGSGNPGTMNMLRSFGFYLALATFLAEVIKAGATCLVFKVCFPQYGQLIYFFSGLFIMLGYNFPVWSRFKGGKGVACFAGIFLFSNLWYVALGWFVICFILLIIIDYGSVTSLVYTGTLTIAYTVYVWVAGIPYAWAITSIVWFLYILTVLRHHSNIKRLINHTENRVDFKGKLKKIFVHKKGTQIIDETEVEQKPEKEIIIDDTVKKTEPEQKAEEQTEEKYVQKDEIKEENVSLNDDKEEAKEENSLNADKDLKPTEKQDMKDDLEEKLDSDKEENQTSFTTEKEEKDEKLEDINLQESEEIFDDATDNKDSISSQNIEQEETSLTEEDGQEKQNKKQETSASDSEE